MSHNSCADLAPRDIVARAIMDEMLHSGEPCMYLDVSGVKHDIPTRFPTIYQHCMELGIDINKGLLVLGKVIRALGDEKLKGR